MRYVIIGNSIAGISAAEAIRETDPEGAVTIISDEKRPFYSRCMTSYYIAGKIPAEKMIVKPQGYYGARRFELLAGRKAVSIDAPAKRVVLDDGSALEYDRLLIATGSRAKLPDVTGANLPGVHVLRTWDDAEAISERALKGSTAVVVGGGLVGMKVAHALHERELEVCVVISSGRVLSQMLDDESAGIIKNLLENHGMKVFTRTDVLEIFGGSQVEGVRLNNGKELKCSLVVVGKGVDANLELAREAGLKVNYGVLVDDRLRTSDPDIYAAGDVAEAYDLIRGEPWINAMWPVASEQGRIAGLNMAGKSVAYAGSIGMNSIELFGVAAISMGITRPRGDEYEVLPLQVGPVWYRKLVFRNDVLVGAIFVDDIEQAGVALGIIKGRQPLSADQKRRLLYGPVNYAAFKDLIDVEDHMVRGGRPNVEAIMQGCY